MGAPAGVSQDLQQFTRFYPGSKRDSLRMHVCAAIGQVQRISAGATGAGLVDTSQEFNSAQLNLTNPAGLQPAGTKTNYIYNSPVFDLIASAFVRYRMKKLVFHYEPQSAATASERMVFAFANDPLHPVLWNASPPNQAALLSLSDSIAFAPWRAWSMDVTNKVSQDKLYTYSDASTTVTEFAERFSDFGVISCVTNSVSGSSAGAGIIYMECEIELEEFCPISTTRPGILTNLKRKVDVAHSKVLPEGRPVHVETCVAGTPGENQGVLVSSAQHNKCCGSS